MFIVFCNCCWTYRHFCWFLFQNVVAAVVSTHTRLRQIDPTKLRAEKQQPSLGATCTGTCTDGLWQQQLTVARQRGDACASDAQAIRAPGAAHAQTTRELGQFRRWLWHGRHYLIDQLKVWQWTKYNIRLFIVFTIVFRPLKCGPLVLLVVVPSCDYSRHMNSMLMYITVVTGIVWNCCNF